jgi:hypothetical protein
MWLRKVFAPLDERIRYQRLRRHRNGGAAYLKWHWLLGLVQLEPYPDSWPKSPMRWVLVRWFGPICVTLRVR